MNKLQQLREMLEGLEDSLGIWGDIIAGLCLMLTLYGVLIFALVL
tara:strand:- start:39 stop:173 length:135 start_codon:yes stop_codon:yes gene_type:complete